MDNNLNDNARTDGTDTVTTMHATPRKSSNLALLLSFAAGAAAAWIIMSVTQQNNEAIESEQQAAVTTTQTRQRPAQSSQTGKNKPNVPRPVTQ